MIEGTAALAAVEAAGIRIDVPYLERTLAETRDRIRGMESKLRESDEYKLQRRRYGERTNLGSREQLGHVLFEQQNYEIKRRTGTGRAVVDEWVLQDIGSDYCKNFLSLEKLKKIEGTYLSGVLRETIDGFCHPTFPLYKVVTFRGASADPNFQNLPIRDKELGKLIRRAFIPRDGHVLLEIDLKANEVRVAACYHKDPQMVADILGSYDLHADMARECFILPADCPIDSHFKTLRNLAKGNFVFAAFYGSYYVDIARALWDESADLMMPGGEKTVHQHLREMGITGRGDCIKGERHGAKEGTFEKHIQVIETAFWGTRFPVYDQWRRDWYDSYIKKGWFQMLTGFTVVWGIGGPLKRNEAINSPVQGAAFHCLLWGLIRLQRWLRLKKMKSIIVGQIHDAVLIDAAEDEWREVAEKFQELMVEEIRKAWQFLIVPLGVETSMSSINWYEKKEVHI